MKLLIRIFLCGILLAFILGLVAFFYFKGTQPPGIEEAPYALQAYYIEAGIKIPTRYYYAEKIELIKGQAVLTPYYWDYDGARYHKHKGEKPVDPPFIIIKREQ